MTKSILTGVVITMNQRFDVLAPGRICISGDRIEHVLAPGDALPADYAGVVAIDTRGTIYPGLIELHNHLSYNMLPLWDVPKKYTAREDWQRDPDYKRRVSLPPRTIGQDPGLLPAMTRYVEAKCLMAGVTTSQGIGLVNTNSIKKYYRGSVRNVETQRDKALPGAGTSVADVSDWTAFKRELDKASCILLHLAEGTDDRSYQHFQSLKNPAGEWAISPALAGIHCVALKDGSDFDALGQRKAGIVWSPLSNFLLYGDTTRVALARAAGCALALGSDWSPSGSKNLLFELKVAHIASAARNHGISDRDLVASVTCEPARMLKWNASLGSIAPGKLADLTVIAGKAADPYALLVRSKEKDIALVLIGGERKYGRATLMKGVPAAETLHVGERKFAAVFDRDPDLLFMSLSEATETLGAALRKLPELVGGKWAHQLGLAAAAPDTGWRLADDAQEDVPFDANREQRRATFAALAATPPLPTVPIDLDPLTIGDDPHFIERIRAARNLPADIRDGLAQFY
jgi:5-methylthioadenosine/S-adenosylhomocysteine deaminase